MMDLVKEKEESKKKIMLSVIVGVITVIGGTALFCVAEMFEMAVQLRILFIVLGLIVITGGIFTACALDMDAGTFECRYCKARFKPSKAAYLAGAHMLTTRRLKCPECGKTSYCKKRLTH